MLNAERLAGLGSDCACFAFANTRRPTGKSIGDVAAVAVGGNTQSQVTTSIEGTRVVHASGLVEPLDAIS